MTSQNRRHGDAPSEAAPSSSVLMSTVANTAMTDRTMNGMVKITWPTRMKSQERRKVTEAAVGEQQRQRDREPWNRQRQRDYLLDDARRPPRACSA